MATYTDNYQLTKPTYAEQADIGVVNSNMNKIDEVMHSSQISLAPAYDQSQTYAEGDVVMYELLMYKCISPTTGVWDASKWERTTASESGGGGTAELDILGEGNGAVVSFADGASAGLAKCIADINPVQDLHGYDKPWAGGAGKNLLNDSTVDIGTYSGVTVSKNNKGQFILNGTATANNSVVVGSCTLPAGSYSLNGMTTVGTADTFFLNIAPAWSGSGNYNLYSGDYNGSPTEERSYIVRIYWRMGAVFNNTVFEPMLRKSTDSDTFEPYSNICPISGSTSVTVTVSDGETSTTKTAPLGQTVYGGQLNVLTGELTVDRAIVDLGSFNWSSESATISGLARVGIEEVRPLGAVYNQTPICSSYEGVIPKGYTAFNNGEIGFSNNEANPMIRVRDQNFASMTDAQIKSAMNGVTLCYKLATPQTVQLTPQEVNSLLGQNNISADTGDVDIVYVKASAPIQPNPTGTPTATLKKLGIEGTVFEIESGGGGSSEAIITGQERVIGTYNNKPLYQLDIQADDISGNTNITQAPITLERLVSYGGCAYDRTNDQYMSLPIFATSSYYARLYIYNGNVYMEIPSSIHIDVSITLRYTKITD